jgi:hypothetical protein
LGADLEPVSADRWCPSCAKGWPAERAVCPDCLVELVEDPAATVPCRHCGKSWPARMHSCPECLAELRVDPEAAAEALGDILAAGAHLFRPDHLPAFRDGPSCSLLRMSGQGGLVLLGPDALVEAEVDGPGGLAVAPLLCRDVDGSVLFRLVRYEAAPRALVAVGRDGAALGTFLRTEAGIDVRDETSAPVAALRRARGGFELVETGGGVLATLGTADAERDGWVDDQWWLTTGPDRLPLRALAAVAMVVAAKVLLGRPAPVLTPEEADRRREQAEWRLYGG